MFGKILHALISSYIESTSSKGAVEYAPIRAVNATRFGFKPRFGRSSKKYFAARCWFLPKPQHARMAEDTWYTPMLMPWDSMRSSTEAAASTSPSSAAAAIRAEPSTWFSWHAASVSFQTLWTRSWSFNFPKIRRATANSTLLVLATSKSCMQSCSVYRYSTSSVSCK